jgi:hypothetical protein
MPAQEFDKKVRAASARAQMNVGNKECSEKHGPLVRFFVGLRLSCDSGVNIAYQLWLRAARVGRRGKGIFGLIECRF